MEKFIYVFNPDTRDEFLKRGFTLLKSDNENGIYVFVNQPSLMFAVTDASYLLSDTLTF